ncbi:MAG: type I-F CRISPR-associated protein Csy3 [Verrucomicrobiales bacterium]|nr:type I-F CRISPR-associated protein Csy3 [Verrucomicrobiales bacterium]
MAKAIIDDKATVLAFEKKLIPSDAFLYETNWDAPEQLTPIGLTEKSVRGTISNRLKPAVAGDPAKLNKEVEKANLQRVDACSLSPHADTLVMKFTLKVLGNLSTPSACNNLAFRNSYKAAMEKYISETNFSELGNRYATNIANARFLWRNRVGADQITVKVKDLINPSNSWSFNAHDYRMHDFKHDDPNITNLGKQIADVLSGTEEMLLLEVTCLAKVGHAQEVYPSEELVLDKSNGKGEKSKILYQVDGTAALHSQKVGNALRSIDTWYTEFSNPETTNGAIAIEPYGAVTNLGKAYRTPKEKRDFYSLFDKWSRGEELSSIEDTHFVAAVLVRGGVFGEKS